MRILSVSALFASLLISVSSALAQDRPAVVELQTNLGTIAISLDYAKAPVTADNFIDYVNSGFYQDTLIHRVVKDFVVQGGGFARSDGKLKTTFPPIVNEANNGLSNVTGTIAMARTNDPNSATSQFFINLVDNTGLDYGGATSPGYAVFGRVARGMPVVRAIGGLPTLSSLPFTASSSLVWIDAVHVNAVWDRSVAVTRVTLSGSGSVSSVPAGIDCGTGCSISQPAGAALKLIATADANNVFGGWRGDCRGQRRIIVLDTSKGNTNCTAVFLRQGPLNQ